MPAIRTHIEWSLPMQIWYPYEVDNYFIYMFAYFNQIIGGVPLICMHIAVDSLFVGLVLEICIKLELFKKRLKTIERCTSADPQYKNVSHENMGQTDNTLKMFLRRHARILEWVKHILIIRNMFILFIIFIH
jgi:hypothetical protein